MIEHPVLNNIKTTILYISVWIFWAILSFVFLYEVKGISLEASIFNSLFFSFYSALMGIAIWYTVLYSFPERVGLTSVIINHITSAFIFISVFILILIWINKTFFHDLAYIIISKRIFQIVFTFILFYVAFVLSYQIYIYRINLEDKKKREESLSQMIREAELNLLKSQINPHFLFNSLNSISALTLTNPEKAHEMILLLSDFLRYSIPRDSRQLSTLENELQNIERYLKIEKIRFGERIDFQKQVTNEAATANLPVMILQPIFENAIKHGVSESTQKVLISLVAYLQAGILVINVSNNFDPETPSRKGTGLGLKNINERLKLIYHADGLISYIKKDNIFEVKLLIPQIQT